METAYNFASAKDAGSVLVPLGGEATGRAYFYNVDGNRTTHVTLRVSEGTSGWDVRLDPPVQKVAVEVNGVVGEVEENLYVEPSALLSAPAHDVPAGSECISVPGRGYALAKTASLVVRPPKDAKPGDRAKFTVAAEAQWLGQTGAAAIKQARTFDFTAEVAGTGAHEEKVLGSVQPQEGANSIGRILASIPDAWFAAGAVVVLAALAWTRLGSGRRAPRDS